MKLEEQSTPALSAGPVLGEHFQPHGIKEDRAGGMADTVPCSSSLPHSPAPGASCSPSRFFTATMVQAAVPGRCQADPELELPPLLSEGIKTPETLGWRWGTGGCH